MARIRSIKPEFWGDEKLAPLSPTTRLVFLGLISMADDRGRLLDSIKRIDAFIFPDTSETSRGSVDELAAIGRIRRGITASGQKIIEIVNWRHQKIEKPNYAAALPDITQEVTPLSATHRGDVGEESPTDRGGVGDGSTIYDLRSTINDHGSKGRKTAAPRSEKKFPDFPADARNELHAYWTEKIGAVNFPVLVNAIGPYWKPGNAGAVRLAVRDYCGLITKGRSAPFASPADLAKKLGALIQNAARNADNPVARLETAETVIHGRGGVAA